jgi:hypothetical protein
VVTPCPHELEDPGCALNDRALWWQANSGMWFGRVSEKAMLRQRRSLPADEFAREFFSWWEDPPEGEALSAFNLERWRTAGDASVGRGASPVFGVAVAPDRSWSAVCVAWRKGDGGSHVVIGQDAERHLDYRPGTAWVRDRVAHLRRTYGGRVLVNVAARGLVDGADEIAEDRQAQADNRLADLLEAGLLSHGNQPALNTAVSGAQWRARGNTRVLDQKGSTDIAPLIAASLAVHGVHNEPPAGGWMLGV